MVQTNKPQSWHQLSIPPFGHYSYPNFNRNAAIHTIIRITIDLYRKPLFLFQQTLQQYSTKKLFIVNFQNKKYNQHQSSQSSEEFDTMNYFTTHARLQPNHKDKSIIPS